MTTTINPQGIEAAKPAHPPCVRSLLLLRRMYGVCPTFAVSLGLLLGWQREEIALRAASAVAARAVDDPIEAAMPDIERALRNDPPSLRRKVLAALRLTHQRSEQLHDNLAVNASPSVLAVGPGEETSR